MSENKTELKRSLGLIDATSLVAGSMIDLNFIVTSAMARDIALLLGYWSFG
jgi:APA family basic amino acid/polyamine antiporter